MNTSVHIEGLDVKAEEHKVMRRMPALLGLASGPRNMPRSKAHLTYSGDVLQVTMHALTDAAALSGYLPARCRLAGEPVLSVAFTQLRNLGWLAGRGYNFINVSTPIVFEGETDIVTGDFSLCIWESKADPIMTGREDVGMPKLFADIPDPRETDGRWQCTASWEGFPFLYLDLDTNTSSDGPVAPSSLGSTGVYIVHRYHAQPGAWDQVDVDQIVISRAGDAPSPTVLEHRTGLGKFGFRPVRWEDMPTQYTYVNALAELPLLEFRCGQFVRAKGIGDLRAFRVVT